jgi:hypothetical protein
MHSTPLLSRQAEPRAGTKRNADLAIGAVRRQALTVGEELIPGDVAWMMVRNDDAPLIGALRLLSAGRLKLNLGY